MAGGPGPGGAPDRKVRAMERALEAVPRAAWTAMDQSPGGARGEDALKLPEDGRDFGPGSAAWDSWAAARKQLDQKTPTKET